MLSMGDGDGGGGGQPWLLFLTPIVRKYQSNRNDLT